MPKAKLVLPNGTEVTIDGTTEEVTALLDHYCKVTTGSASAKKQATRPAKEKKGKTKTKKSSTGPMGLIRDLVGGNYFKERRTLSAVQKKLEEGGHIYAQTSLSPPLLKLVQNKELRRVKDGKRWVYVNP